MQSTSSDDSYALAANALIIAEPGDGARDAAEALALAGVRAIGPIRFSEAPARLGEQALLDLILIEAMGVPDDLIDAVLARTDAIAGERGTAVVVAITEDQIDLAAAHLLSGACQLLCAPSMAERVAALAVAMHRVTGRVQDGTRDPEALRLQRLNQEVARIAEALARLTRSEEEAQRGVRAPGHAYRGPGDGDGEVPGAAEIRAVIRARRLRTQFFNGELFADPAWDMLLDLFAADLEQRRVSVSSLCIAAAVPPTTALRWIGSLHEAGLFERRADPSDRRRAYVGLSEKGSEGMRAYVSAVKRSGLPLV